MRSDRGSVSGSERARIWVNNPARSQSRVSSTPVSESPTEVVTSLQEQQRSERQGTERPESSSFVPDYGSEVRAPQGTPPGDLVDGGCHSLAAETRTEFDSCQRSVSEPNGAVPGTQPSDDISMTGHGGQERCGAIRVAESVKSKASSRKSEEIERLSASLRQLEAEASETRRQLEEARARSEASSARSVLTRSSRAIAQSATGAHRSEPGVIPVSLSSSAISGLTPLGLAQVCAEPRATVGTQVFAMDAGSDGGSPRSNGDDLREVYEFRVSEPRQAEQRVEESMYTCESMREEAGAQVEIK